MEEQGLHQSVGVKEVGSNYSSHRECPAMCLCNMLSPLLCHAEAASIWLDGMGLQRRGMGLG